MVFKAGNKYFDLDKKPVIMGILNVTPDSFSDGGKFSDPAAALQRCAQMIKEGAGIIDIGGESSRPGSERISSQVELERIIPVIRELRKTSDICISVDTYKPDVAAIVLEEGADMINNICGTDPDEELLRIVAGHSAGLCLMHMRGTPENMQDFTSYDDIVEEILTGLRKSYERALEAGIDKTSVVLDPGIGFGKSIEGNLKLLKDLSAFTEIGCPVLIGTSRKSFIGGILGNTTGERLSGTLSANVIAFLRGARLFRVHDVKENYESLEVARRIVMQE